MTFSFGWRGIKKVLPKKTSITLFKFTAVGS